ncbi:MAG: hypothetical protein NVS1B6_15410 [Steroidobacteraceae bacterium]
MASRSIVLQTSNVLHRFATPGLLFLIAGTCLLGASRVRAGLGSDAAQAGLAYPPPLLPPGEPVAERR